MTDSDAPSDRRDPITEQHGDWTITIYDDQRIADGQKYAAKARIVITHGGRVWREGLRDSYTIWTVLAHWQDALPVDPFPADIPSDRDALAEVIHAEHLRLADERVVNSPRGHAESFADAFLASDWLAVHDRAVIGQTHAPILALLDDAPCVEDTEAEVVFVDDLRAALTPAAVADHERAVEQRALRDAARQARALPDRSSPNAALDEAEAWATWLDYRADALGQPRPHSDGALDYTDEDERV